MQFLSGKTADEIRFNHLEEVYEKRRKFLQMFV